MKRSKKVFLILSGIFLVIMIIIGYDISQRTTFPGSRSSGDKEGGKIIDTDSLDYSTEIN